MRQVRNFANFREASSAAIANHDGRLKITATSLSGCKVLLKLPASSCRYCLVFFVKRFFAYKPISSCKCFPSCSKVTLRAKRNYRAAISGVASSATGNFSVLMFPCVSSRRYFS